MTIAAPLLKAATRAVWLGRVGYDEGLRLQREAAARVAAGGEETLLLLQYSGSASAGG